MLRPSPVAEHDWNSRQHLRINLGLIAVFKTRQGIPAICLHLPKHATIHDHPSTPGLMMHQLHKSTVPVSIGQIRPRFGQDVRMDINRGHRLTGVRNGGLPLVEGALLVNRRNALKLNRDWRG